MSRVLVVEDSQSQREMIGKLLQENGFEVMTVGDGVEAVEAVKQSKPDLIVLDIVMPRMNGYEVCRLLKADPLTQKPRSSCVPPRAKNSTATGGSAREQMPTLPSLSSRRNWWVRLSNY